VSLYAPKGSAADTFRGFKEGDEIEVKGELDEGKDKDGNKKLQVKVLSAHILTAQRPNGRGSEYIDDQDFSF
jgi:hypothetical protein